MRACPPTSSTPRTATGSTGSPGPQGQPIHAFDVGAHVGTFACHLAEAHPTRHDDLLRAVGDDGRYLQRNIDQNGLGNRISVVEAALSGETGSALFDDHGGASVHSGLAEGHPVDDPHAAGRVKVRTLGFDDAIAAEPAAPVTFVKLDCEGGEYQMAYRSSPESWATRAAGRPRVPRHPR